jgi:hypothetical protein
VLAAAVVVTAATNATAVVGTPKHVAIGAVGDAGLEETGWGRVVVNWRPVNCVLVASDAGCN